MGKSSIFSLKSGRSHFQKTSSQIMHDSKKSKSSQVKSRLKNFQVAVKSSYFLKFSSQVQVK